MKLRCRASKHRLCSLAVEELRYQSFVPGREYEVSDAEAKLLLSTYGEFFELVKEQPSQDDKMLRSQWRKKNGS